MFRVVFLKDTQLTCLQESSQISLEKANAEVSRLQNQGHENQPTQLLAGNSIVEVEQLRQDLTQAHNDVEALKAASAVNGSVAAIQTQDGSSSIAEQIAAQVSEIRAELVARHEERVSLAEGQYQKRSETMRAQLSKRLADGRAEIRQQAIDGLKVEHEQELEALRTRHREELEELRRNENIRFEDFKEQWRAEHPGAGLDEPRTIKGETQSTKSISSPSDMTDAEIRNLIATNDVIKSIMKKNIVAHGAKERERVLEEQQKITNEKLAEAEKVKEQAVIMEGKKYNVKISMTENRARAAQAKIDYVQKAATETPQKPVIEVWEVAKDIKPAPIQSQQPQTSAAPPVPLAVVNPFARPPPAGPGLGQSMFGKPSFVSNQPNPLFGPSGLQQAQTGTTTQTPSPRQIPTNSADSSSAINGLQPQTAGQPAVQDNPSEDQGSQRINPGTGPAALRSIQQSNLPLPSGGRGVAGMGRGRGRGAGRGQLPQVQTGVPTNAPQSQGSPRGGQLSATAKQFVPQGAKRPRDDGLEASQHAKRVRGGLHGS